MLKLPMSTEIDFGGQYADYGVITLNDAYDNAQTIKQALKDAEDNLPTEAEIAEVEAKLAEAKAARAAKAAKEPCPKCGGSKAHPAADSGMPSGVCPKDC